MKIVPRGYDQTSEREEGFDSWIDVRMANERQHWIVWMKFRCLPMLKSIQTALLLHLSPSSSPFLPISVAIPINTNIHYRFIFKILNIDGLKFDNSQRTLSEIYRAFDDIDKYVDGCNERMKRISIQVEMLEDKTIYSQENRSRYSLPIFYHSHRWSYLLLHVFMWCYCWCLNARSIQRRQTTRTTTKQYTYTKSLNATNHLALCLDSLVFTTPAPVHILLMVCSLKMENYFHRSKCAMHGNTIDCFGIRLSYKTHVQQLRYGYCGRWSISLSFARRSLTSFLFYSHSSTSWLHIENATKYAITMHLANVWVHFTGKRFEQFIYVCQFTLNVWL